MNIYKEISFHPVTEEKADILVGLLSQIGYYGFEQEDNLLKAFINEADFDKKALGSLAESQQVSYTIDNIMEQNWNALWESNFTPLKIGQFAGIRASFHAPLQDIKHELIITPKMSFGTGHHATTYMMIQQMEGIPFQNAQVLDFGTGTGVLSILAEQLGAASILAIDNDEWSIRNATENAKANHCKAITIQQANSAEIPDREFDIILANINKNVIISNFPHLTGRLKKGGFLLLSGLLADDEADIEKQAQSAKLVHKQTIQRLQWISILYQN